VFQFLPPQKLVVLLDVLDAYFASELGLGGNLAPKNPYRATEKKGKQPPA
jgi:hypothetical protein